MTKHKIMTRKHGDLAIEFSPDDEAAVALAKQRFEALIKDGHIAIAGGKDGQPGCVVRDFNPEDDIVFQPQIIGG